MIINDSNTTADISQAVTANLLSTKEAAELLDVSPRAVANWRSRKLFGCHFFTADEKHGNTWYYERERVEQLKSVYQKGVLDNMYKLAFLNAEAEEDVSELFQKTDSSLQPPVVTRHRGLLTAEYVAAKFNVTVQAVEKWVKSGELHWTEFDHKHRLLFSDNDIEAFERRREKNTEGKTMGFAIKGFDDVQAAGDDELAYNYREEDEPATAETVKPELPTTAAPADNFANFTQQREMPAGFGILPAEEFNNEYLRLIKADLAEAQAHLEELPISERRGLTLETLRHFHCGYLPKWILTKSRAEFKCGIYVNQETGQPKRLPPASERIIIPTASMEHFNAVATPRERRRMSDEAAKNFAKQHAGEKFLFCDADALNADVIVVVEGEVDAMTIWQVSTGKIAVVAIMGCSNFRKTLGVKLSQLKGKKFILLLDADAAGKKNAVKIRDGLIREGYPAVCAYLYDYMPYEFKKHPQNIKVDANSILTQYGADQLNSCLQNIIERALPQLDFAAAEIEKNKMPQGADPDILLPKPRKTQSKPADKANIIFDDDLNEDRQIVADCLKVVPASQLTRDDWYTVGCVIKYYDFGFEVFDQWSNDGDPRYTAAACKTQWDSMKTADECGSSAVKIGTLINIAKEFGYQPPHRAKDISPTTGDAELDELLAVYRNTYETPIDPKIISELKTAKEFVDNLTPENISAADVASLKNRRLIALLTVYVPSLAKKYYLGLRGIRDVSSSAEEKEIKPLVAIVKSKQKKYQQQCEEAARQARQDERAFVQSKMIQRLKELREKPQSAERDAEMIQLIRDSCEWKMNIHGDRVAVKATQANADLIFNYDPAIDGLFAFDEFQARDVFLKAPPWDKTVTVGAEWRDLDEAHLQRHLRATYTEFASKDLVYTNTVAYSYMRKFHKIKDFFNNLPAWDGVKRAETLFVKFLRADDSPYVREVTLNWLTAAVARIFHPGCDYQLAPILLGAQGIGKTTLIGALGGAWYGSLTSSVDDPHAVDDIQPLWIVEIKEMVSLKKDVDANKRFIDARADDRRAPYEKYSKKTPRHVVFIVTTNNPQCLVDRTGNRRYPVIKCNSKQGEYTEIPDGYIQQVWSEVFAHFNELFADGFDERKLVLSKAAQKESNDHAEAHLRDDGIDGEIAAFLDVKILPPVIWNLLTREEHRKFIAEGKFTIAEHDIIARFKNSRKRIPADLQDEFDKAKEEGDAVSAGYAKEPKTNISIPILTFYGTEYRQRICAAEIFNECFGTDRRKSMPRIYESLNRLAGWHLGARIKNYPCYGDQKNVYYRDAANFPADDEPENKSTEPTAPTSFSGTVIDPDDTPF